MQYEFYPHEDLPFFVYACYDGQYHPFWEYKCLQDVLTTNDEYVLAAGKFLVSPPAGRPDWSCAQIMGRLTYELRDSFGKIIHPCSLVGWVRNSNQQRLEYMRASHRNRRSRRNENHKNHKKAWSFRRPKTLRELRASTDPEHMPYVRRKRRQVPVAWDDRYYCDENNWKSSTTKRYQWMRHLN